MSTLWIRLTDAQKAEIKSLAEKAGCSASDYVLSKALDLPLEEIPEKEYTFTVKGKQYSTKSNNKKRKKVMKTELCKMAEEIDSALESEEEYPNGLECFTEKGKRIFLRYCSNKEVEFLKGLAVYNIKQISGEFDDFGSHRYEITKR